VLPVKLYTGGTISDEWAQNICCLPVNGAGGKKASVEKGPGANRYMFYSQQ